MTVYVDDMHQHPMGLMRSPSGRVMRMSHMLADTSEELMAMAYAIGMRPEWIQKPGTAREHFDVPLFRRRMAIKLGAREITMRDAAALVRNRSTSALKVEP